MAIAEGGPKSLIQDGETGLLVDARAAALEAGIITLATQPLLRKRLGVSALAAARERTWEASMRELADGYSLVLAQHPAVSRQVA